MSVKYKNGDEVSDSIGLLISILVRYPEVGSINFDPQAQELRLTFILAGNIEKTEISGIKNIIVDSVHIYHQLERIRPRVFLVECNFNDDNYAIIDVKRDVDTLTRNEIGFLMELFHVHFPHSLVAENNEELWEEDLLLQEELIGHMLEGMKNVVTDKKIIAYRDEGKVLIFNK